MIYLISRDARFSPNSTTRDETVFKAVALQFVLRGRAIRTLDESGLPDELPDAEAVLSMGRSVETLRRLSAWERGGLLVLNAPDGLLENSRSRLSELIARSGVGARYVANERETATVVERLSFPLWLKRGDACAQTAGDVRFVTTREELDEAMTYFMEKGYADVVAEEHLEGDLIKFYGVEGTEFFRYAYPTDGGFSKFGLEKHNGTPSFFPFSSHDLKQTADEIARLSGMLFYGGDAVIGSNGEFSVIDFNDWPSFGDYAQEAAIAIVERTLSLLQDRSAE